MRYLLLSLLLLLPISAHAQTQMHTQQFAALESCQLENGAVITDCRIGYITVGTLNATRSNAILFPTWHGGRASDILKYIGSDSLVDPQKYFVILVDSFGNGVSSSPSNSASQSGKAFPAVSLKDMVRLQKQFIQAQFNITKLHAVVGVSMGAMQAFEWSVSETAMAEKFVAIAGSPQLATFDVVFWDTHIQFMQAMIDCKCQQPMATLDAMRFLMLGADYQATRAPREQLEKARETFKKNTMTESRAYDRILQMQAMIGHDVAKSTAGDLTAAAKKTDKKLLIVIGTKDVIVTPTPARDFAKLGDIKIHELPNCGHNVPVCSADLISPAVRDFLSR